MKHYCMKHYCMKHYCMKHYCMLYASVTCDWGITEEVPASITNNHYCVLL